MMTRHLGTACLIYFALALQATTAHEIAVYDVRPWFPGIVLVACVLLHRGASAIGWAGVLGLGVDSVSSERLGVQLAIACIIAGVLSAASEETPSNGPLLKMIFVIVATFLWRSLNGMVQAWLCEQAIDPLRILILSSGDASYTAALTLMLLICRQTLKRGLRRREARSPFSLNNQWSMLTRFER